MTEHEIESKYQKSVTDKLKELFTGCIIIKNDSGYIQGIPDWTMFYGKLWATLEIKRTKHARRQPNQPYYVERMNNMGYSAFVYPDNEQLIIEELIEYFKGEKPNDI